MATPIKVTAERLVAMGMAPVKATALLKALGGQTLPWPTNPNTVMHQGFTKPVAEATVKAWGGKRVELVGTGTKLKKYRAKTKPRKYVAPKLQPIDKWSQALRALKSNSQGRRWFRVAHDVNPLQDALPELNWSIFQDFDTLVREGVEKGYWSGKRKTVPYPMFCWTDRDNPELSEVQDRVVERCRLWVYLPRGNKEWQYMVQPTTEYHTKAWKDVAARRKAAGLPPKTFHYATFKDEDKIVLGNIREAVAHIQDVSNIDLGLPEESTS